jgi:plastocyanin
LEIRSTFQLNTQPSTFRTIRRLNMHGFTTPKVIRFVTMLVAAILIGSHTLATGASAFAGGLGRLVNMHDACDPTTFNAPPPAGVGPGTCARDGGVRFQDFIAELTRHQFVGAWHFAPPMTDARVGQTLVAINKGREVHTFTRVESFGGGIVPPLNVLSGNPIEAAECAKLEPDDFVTPGATYTQDLTSTGTAKFQCCIHPWMRLEVQVVNR